MRKIPVFFHIPKNAGTYVSLYSWFIFRHYRENFTKWTLDQKDDLNTIKIIQIIQNNHIIARVLVGDPNFYCDKNPTLLIKNCKNEFNIEYSNLNKVLFENLFVFFIIIESHGFRMYSEVLNNFDSNVQKFLILREPFSRSQSLYNYNISNASILDYNHGTIESKTFAEYISSDKFEENWLFRNLLNIPDNAVVTEQHFNIMCYLLKDFAVYDIKNVDNALKEIFLKCYELDTNIIKLHLRDDITKNNNNYKKIKFYELSLEAQKTFIEKTYWENRLYAKYI